MKKDHFNKENLIKFYQTLNFTNFQTINEERKIELDKIALKHRYYFHDQTVSFKSRFNFLCQKLVASAPRFDLNNGDEKVYFLINILDHDLDVLKLYENSNTVLELQKNMIMYFGIYDRNLIALERKYNEYFKVYEPEDLIIYKDSRRR